MQFTFSFLVTHGLRHNVLMNLRKEQTAFVFALCSAFAVQTAVASATTAENSATTDRLFDMEPETVITPTRLRQSVAELPAAVTVVTAAMISDNGLRSLPEALRLVPGMIVTQVSGNDYRVNYHGGNVLIPRRINVMIDGISVYRPGLARVDWSTIPVLMSDIERIEVTRGPASAAYGPNSMTAVVNVITKTARATGSTTQIGVQYGSGDRNISLQHGDVFSNGLAYRISMQREITNGYDANPSVKVVGHDGQTINRGTLGLEFAPSARDSLGVQALFAEGTKQVEFVDARQTSFPDVHFSDVYGAVNWRRDWSDSLETKVRATVMHADTSQKWSTCIPMGLFVPELGALWRINPALATALVTGVTPKPSSAAEVAALTAAARTIGALGALARQNLCGTTGAALTERRVDIEAQATVVASPQLRGVIGVGYRRDSGISDALSSGKGVSANAARVFVNAEYRPITEVTLNLGLYVDRDGTNGSKYLPRVGANWAVSPTQILRASWAVGARRPDLQEQQGNWSYRMANANPGYPGVAQPQFFQTAVARGGLLPERNERQEVGYQGNWAGGRTVADVVVFREMQRDLVSEKLAINSFAPTNKGSLTISGVEATLGFKPTEKLSLSLGGALIHSRSKTPLELTQTVPLSGFLRGTYAWSEELRVSGVAYASNSSSPGLRSFGRQDLSVRYTPRAFSNMALTGTLSHLDNVVTGAYQDIGRISTSSFNQSVRGIIGIELAL